MANLRLLLLIPLCLILIPFKSPDTGITFMDVGQGDGIFISSGGEDILIDCGSSSTKKIGKYTLEPFLKSQRTGSIEKLFVTHADSDHINGLIYLGQSTNISVKEIYLPACAEGDENYDELREAFHAGAVTCSDDAHNGSSSCTDDAHADSSEYPDDAHADSSECPDDTGGSGDTDPGMRTLISYIKAGDIIQLENGTITCMSPADSAVPDDMNAQSLILYYRENNFSALFTGDAPKESELTMLSSVRSGQLPGISGLTLLKVGHHGSKTSTSEELLSASEPLVSILSYGDGNRYGHPHKETTDLLEQYHVRMLHTAESGAVTVTTDGDSSVHISQFCAEDPR